MMGDILLNSDIDDGLYMIGDYNLTGLEDCFITGIYAGNKVADRTTD